MNGFVSLPVDFQDLDQISLMLAESGPVVSVWDELAKGDWRAYCEETVFHGNDLYAHLDTNFLSYLVDVYDGRSPNELRKKAAAFMSLAICMDLKVNPTVAIHEYALTSTCNPDERLAAFYAIDNTHPQLLADYALGRVDAIEFPDRSSLEPTPHHDKLATPIKGHAFYEALVLKIAEIDFDPGFGGRKLESQVERYRAFIRWMFEELGFGAAASFAAAQLWGRCEGKPALKFKPSDKYGDILRAINNSVWDIVAVESWAEEERSRLPGDPLQVFCTFDKALAVIGRQLFINHGETTEEYIDRVLQPFWPKKIARELTTEYMALQARRDDPCRKINQGEKDLDAIRDGVRSRIKQLLGES